MSAYTEDLLRARLDAVAPTPMPADWLDVRRRARDRHRRTLVLAALAAALVIVLVGCTAVFGPRVISFADTEPSPPAAIDWLELVRVSRQMTFGGRPGLDPRGTRRLLARPLAGRRIALDLTPTELGFCATVVVRAPGRGNRFATDCREFATGQRPEISLLSVPALGTGETIAGRRGGAVALVGWTSAASATRVELAFEDGTHLEVSRVIQVSDPIGAGFFVANVPVPHRTYPRRLVRIVARDTQGKRLAASTVRYPALSDEWSWPRDRGALEAHHGFPRAADASRERKLVFAGTHARIWLAPAKSGALCVIFHEREVGGGGTDICLRTPADEANVRLDADSFVPAQEPAGEQLLWWGRVPALVARIVISFEDGARATTRPADRFVVYPVPPVHVAPGHRPTGAVLFDTGGRVIERIAFDPRAPNRFPCPGGTVASGTCP